MLKIQRTDIDITFISSPKDDLLQYVKFKFWHVSKFYCT